MSNIIDITKYPLSCKHHFIFDANIWLYLYWPNQNIYKDESRIYSDFLKKVRQSNSKIYLFSLILSEFINIWVNEFYRTQKKVYRNKKEWKKSPDFPECLEGLLPVYKKIRSATIPSDDLFRNAPIIEIIENLGNYDFNDGYYQYLAAHSQKDKLKYKFIVVTHDDDFGMADSSITILTANHTLIRSKQTRN